MVVSIVPTQLDQQAVVNLNLENLQLPGVRMQPLWMLLWSRTGEHTQSLLLGGGQLPAQRCHFHSQAQACTLVTGQQLAYCGGVVLHQQRLVVFPDIELATATDDPFDIAGQNLGLASASQAAAYIKRLICGEVVHQPRQCRGTHGIRLVIRQSDSDSRTEATAYLKPVQPCEPDVGGGAFKHRLQRCQGVLLR